MKFLFKTTMAAALAVAATGAASVPAQAQVAGIATSSPEAVILQAKARVDGYRAISTAYATQIQQVSALRTEVNTLQQGLDTNGDRNLSQAEVDAQPAIIQQIQDKERQIATASDPIVLAQYYVLEQLLGRYGEAQQQVIQNKKIQIMLAPEAFQYAVEGANVTPDILAALDRLVPTVTTTPPAGYQPRRDAVELHQSLQQMIMVAAAQQAAAQRQQGAAQPAQQQPTGR